MASIYQSAVQAHGRHWQWPWLVFALFLTMLGAVACLNRPDPVETQVVCENEPGRRFRAAVEIDGLLWTADLDAALACAFKQNRYVLLAFHAVCDTNARYNEVNVFRDHQVKSAMRRYVLLMLHVDIVPESFYQQKPEQEDRQSDAEINWKFETKTLDTVQEPLYVLLRPKGNGHFEVVARYDEALIKDQARFVYYLENPLRAAQDFK